MHGGNRRWRLDRERQFVERRYLARDSDQALAIATVGRQVELQHLVR